jgi:hypothetical protein
MSEHLLCRQCGAAWLSPVARQLIEEREGCLLCNGELDVVAEPLDSDEEGEPDQPRR